MVISSDKNEASISFNNRLLQGNSSFCGELWYVGLVMKLLLVRAALGSQQEMGQKVTSNTRQMRFPDRRLDGGDYEIHYDSIRAGPHRPFVSGNGDGSGDESIIHAIYKNDQVCVCF